MFSLCSDFPGPKIFFLILKFQERPKSINVKNINKTWSINFQPLYWFYILPMFIVLIKLFLQKSVENICFLINFGPPVTLFLIAFESYHFVKLLLALWFLNFRTFWCPHHCQSFVCPKMSFLKFGTPQRLRKSHL